MKPIHWDENKLILLDQRKLPDKLCYVTCTSVDDVYNAIKKMIVRGAPAIGVTAAYGLVLAVKDYKKEEENGELEYLRKAAEKLGTSRPTAINLNWALSRMISVAEKNSPDNLYDLLVKEAISVHNSDLEGNYKMGEIGADLILPNSSIITHCNAGALATSGYGTALGVVRKASQDGNIEKIYATETRPWFQGSRLTASELLFDKLGVTIIVDSAAGYLMNSKCIDWVIVGADRVTLNGDVINKIGTYNLAILAEKHDTKFMVVAPTSTIDLATESGFDVCIEQRPEEEVKYFNNQLIAPEKANVFNPVFDVTPSFLVDVLVTEKGAILGPNDEKITNLMCGSNI